MDYAKELLIIHEERVKQWQSLLSDIIKDELNINVEFV